MSAFLYRLGRTSARHPFRVLGLWLVAAIAVMALQGSAGGEFDNSERVPGVESQHAADVLNDRFPSQGGLTARIVLHTDDGRLDDADHAATVERARAQLAAGADVAGVTDPFAAGGRRAQRRRADRLPRRHLRPRQAHRHASSTTPSPSPTRPRPTACRSSSPAPSPCWRRRTPSSELIGVGVAIIVLLVAFGSVVAMGLPIVTALIGIFVGAAGVGVLSAFLDIPEFSLILCAMIGLGVGIDYALFIVTRHRQHLHEGMSVEDAAGTAVATAGQAVLFAGTTVVIAILGLFLAGLPAISGMGAAVALVVTVSMVAAVTLLPGLLGLAGTKIDRLSIHRKAHVAKPADETVAGRWAHHVGSHPVRYAIVGLGALCAIAIPALSMRIGVARRRQRPHRHDPAHRLRPAGRRLRPRVQRPDPGRRRAPAPAARRSSQRVHDALQADPGVAAVTAPVLNAAGDTAVLTANPTTAPQDERTDQLVRHLRADVLPATVDGTDAQGVADRPGDGHRPDRPHHRPAPALHRRRRGDVVPPADDRVPVDPRPAQGRPHEPAVDRRRLRRARRRVPVGLGRIDSSGCTARCRSTRSSR